MIGSPSEIEVRHSIRGRGAGRESVDLDLQGSREKVAWSKASVRHGKCCKSVVALARTATRASVYGLK